MFNVISLALLSLLAHSIKSKLSISPNCFSVCVLAAFATSNVAHGAEIANHASLDLCLCLGPFTFLSFSLTLLSLSLCPYTH